MSLNTLEKQLTPKEKELLSILTSQNFHDFYSGPLDDLISGAWEENSEEDKESTRKCLNKLRGYIYQLVLKETLKKSV